jgi:hypothetical protein
MQKNIWMCFVVALPMNYVSCQSPAKNDKGKASVREKRVYNTCYIMAPVDGNSDAVEMREDISDEKVKDLKVCLGQIASGNAVVDSNMLFMTNFRVQKKITVSPDCINKFADPDSNFITEVYTNSFIKTNGAFGSIEFIKSYEKDILNFGAAVVYEFDVTAPWSQAPKHIYVLLQKSQDQVNDVGGIAFCNDEIKWYKTGQPEKDILSLVNWVTGEKQYEVIMNYSNGKFIPVGHSKLNDW